MISNNFHDTELKKQQQHKTEWNNRIFLLAHTFPCLWEWKSSEVRQFFGAIKQNFSFNTCRMRWIIMRTWCNLSFIPFLFFLQFALVSPNLPACACVCTASRGTRMFCSGATNKTMESLYGKQKKNITCKFIEMKHKSTQASYFQKTSHTFPTDIWQSEHSLYHILASSQTSAAFKPPLHE